MSIDNRLKSFSAAFLFLLMSFIPGCVKSGPHFKPGSSKEPNSLMVSQKIPVKAQQDKLLLNGIAIGDSYKSIKKQRNQNFKFRELFSKEHPDTLIVDLIGEDTCMSLYIHKDLVYDIRVLLRAATLEYNHQILLRTGSHVSNLGPALGPLRLSSSDNEYFVYQDISHNLELNVEVDSQKEVFYLRLAKAPKKL